MAEHLNIIIPVALILWTLISGLLVYIWLEMAKRVNKIENEKESSLKLLLSNPVLTITSHSILCSEVWKHLDEKFDSLEENIKLEIKNAVLQVGLNNRKKKN